MNIGQNKSDESRILYMDDHLAVFNKAAGDICAEGGAERGGRNIPYRASKTAAQTGRAAKMRGISPIFPKYFVKA